MSRSQGPPGDVHQFLSAQLTKRPCAASKGLNFVSEHHKKYIRALPYTRKLNPHIWVQFICSWGTLEACNCLSPAMQQFYLSVAAIAIVMSMDTNFLPECEKEVLVIEIHLVVDVGYKVGAQVYLD